jgi:hypothetical protein
MTPCGAKSESLERQGFDEVVAAGSVTGDCSSEIDCRRDLGDTYEAKEEPMSNQHSVTKRHRRPKSAKRADYTARTMAAVKQLEQAAKPKK